MPKYRNLEEYVNTFTQDALKYYNEFVSIMDDLDLDVKVRLFAGQVAFFVEENLGRTFHSSPVVVMAFYKDHVNVFALANLKYEDKLPENKFTVKGTMQISYKTALNKEILSRLFNDSLQKGGV